MIGKSDIAAIVDEYDRLKLRIGMTASHSALDICDGAIEEGFPPLRIAKKVVTRPMQTTSKPIAVRREGFFEAWSIKRLCWIRSTTCWPRTCNARCETQCHLHPQPFVHVVFQHQRH